MGKAGNGERTTSEEVSALEDLCFALEGAQEPLRQAAKRIIRDGLKSDVFVAAGVALVLVEVMGQQREIAAAAMRDLRGFNEPAEAPPADKPKRTRGPRKPRASAAGRTGTLPGTKEPSEEELERMIRPAAQANGGAS